MRRSNHVQDHLAERSCWAWQSPRRRSTRPNHARNVLDQAAQAIRQKNYQDAYAHYRALALDPGVAPSRAADSLKAAIECLEQLARGEEVDELRDATIAAHNDQWRVLLAAAQTLAEKTHAGYIIGWQVPPRVGPRP